MTTWKLYVLHFDKPYKHAKHYTGIAKNVLKRIALHKNGTGARLTQVLKENEISFRYNIIKEFPNFSEAHAYEKYLKTKIKKPQNYCPICKEEKSWQKEEEKKEAQLKNPCQQTVGFGDLP